MAITIKNSTIDFLKKLSKNNNREWFSKNKNLYLAAHEDMLAFVDALLSEMRRHDLIETRTARDSLFRIYRDVRFSKDKSPYKAYWAGHFKRASKKLRGGYYFQIGPGETMAAGGFFNPDPKDLLRIRKDIDMNFNDWKKMLTDKEIVSNNFLKEMNQTFRNLRSYFDYMSEVLTTDANGVSVI